MKAVFGPSYTQSRGFWLFASIVTSIFFLSIFGVVNSPHHQSSPSSNLQSEDSSGRPSRPSSTIPTPTRSRTPKRSIPPSVIHERIPPKSTPSTPPSHSSSPSPSAPSSDASKSGTVIKNPPSDTGSSFEDDSTDYLNDPQYSYSHSSANCKDMFDPLSFAPLFDTNSAHACFHNPTLRSLICSFSDLAIDTQRIVYKGNARGGESIDAVINQIEDHEYLGYRDGTFTIADATSSSPSTSPITSFLKNKVDSVARFHSVNWLKAITVADDESALNCDDTLQGTSLLVTRYEYANLYHSMTDFYNVFLSMVVNHATSAPSRIVFMDAHPQGHMDLFWKALFGDRVHYVSQLGGGRICLQRAVLVPAGYEAALNMIEKSSCGAQPAVAAFSDWVLSRFHLLDVKPSGKLPILVFEFRVNYLAHPRSQGRTARRILNRQEVEEYFASKALELGFEFQSVTSSSIPLEEQIALMRRASVVIAVHGAFLSHVLFGHERLHVVEVIPPGYDARTHFKAFSAWRGVGYDRLAMVTRVPPQGEEYTVDPRMFEPVLQRLFEHH